MITRRRAIVGGVALLGIVALLLGAGLLVEVGDQQSSDGGPQPYDRDDAVGLTASGGSSGGAVDFAAGEATPEPREQQADNGGGDDTLPDVQGRARIVTGEVALQVDDFDATRSALTKRVRRHGGYVSDISQRQHRSGNRTWSTGELTLRVPAENFSRLREETKGSGVVLREDVSTRDVTDQLVDLNARIENLEHQRDRLRTMYERANETEELLAIQKQLSNVQGEIERLEAQQKSLRQRVSYSTLTVELREPRPGSPQIDPPAYHERPLVDAFVSSVNGVIVLVQSAVVTVAYALPYFLVLGVIAVPAWVWRRRHGRR
jgi:hypothetical protein